MKKRNKILMLQSILILFSIFYAFFPLHISFLFILDSIFDFPRFFDTVPEALNRTYNIPKKETLNSTLLVDNDAVVETKINKLRRREYKELEQRLKRGKQERVLEQKLAIGKELMVCTVQLFERDNNELMV
jgi:hypothetical protein